MAALYDDRSSAELAAYFAALSGQHVGVCVEGRQVLVSTDIAGCRITIARRNLEHFDVEVDPWYAAMPQCCAQCAFDPGLNAKSDACCLLVLHATLCSWPDTAMQLLRPWLHHCWQHWLSAVG